MFLCLITCQSRSCFSSRNLLPLRIAWRKPGDRLETILRDLGSRLDWAYFVLFLAKTVHSQSFSLSAVRNGFKQENSRPELIFNLAGLRLKKAESFLVSFITNRGLLALSAGSFDEAHRHFVAATKLDPYNSVVSHYTCFCVFCGSLSQSDYLLLFHINHLTAHQIRILGSVYSAILTSI